MLPGVALPPAGKTRVFFILSGKQFMLVLKLEVIRLAKVLADTLYFFFGQGGGTIFQVLPLFIHLGGEPFWRKCLDQNFDACLEFVVAAAKAIVNSQDCLVIRQHVLPGQKLVDHTTQHWRAAQTTTYQYTEPQLAFGIAAQVQADVMYFGRSTVSLAGTNGNLELARQTQKLRVKS